MAFYDKDTIEEGHHIMLKKGSNLKYIFVKKLTQVRMENFSFYCDGMIGKPFGSAFKVTAKKQLEMIDPILVEEHVSEYMTELDCHAEDMKDNRNINDDNEKSQNLSKEAIMSYRDSGKSGEEIIEQIIENSSTFNDRTEFSKAKYTRKKKKKYLAQFVALRPSTRLLAQMYLNKKADKILHLRPDMLAHMLSLANVHASSNALLVDDTGLLIACLLERILAPGSITLISTNHMCPPQPVILTQLDLSPDRTRDRLCSLPMNRLDDLPSLMQNKSDAEVANEILPSSKHWDISSNSGQCPEDEKHFNAGQKRNQPFSSDCESKRSKYEIESGLKSVAPDEMEKASIIEQDNKHKFCQSKREETTMAINKMRDANFSCLVLVSKFHPKKLLLSLFPYLGTAQPFVVYCAQREPLVDCYMAMQEAGCCCLELADHWFRELQVVPSRTHPHMMMPVGSGFILSGIKVQ